jgi:hypothetical protein
MDTMIAQHAGTGEREGATMGIDRGICAGTSRHVPV